MLSSNYCTSPEEDPVHPSRSTPSAASSRRAPLEVITGGILTPMTLAIDLPPVLLVRVQARAQERGMSLNEYVAKLIEEALPGEPNARGISLLKGWEAEDATDDPTELEARRADWAATKAALNEGHSSERKLFP